MQCGLTSSYRSLPFGVFVLLGLPLYGLSFFVGAWVLLAYSSAVYFGETNDKSSISSSSLCLLTITNANPADTNGVVSINE